MPDIRPPSANLVQEIAQLQQRAQALQLDLATAPHAIVEKLREHIDAVKTDGVTLDEDSLAGIAVILGEQYVRQFGWQWKEVNSQDDWLEEHYVASVLNADDSLAVVPVWWVDDILSGVKSNGVLLHFNLVAANSVPVAEPGAALILH